MIARKIAMEIGAVLRSRMIVAFAMKMLRMTIRPVVRIAMKIGGARLLRMNVGFVRVAAQAPNPARRIALVNGEVWRLRMIVGSVMRILRTTI